MYQLVWQRKCSVSVPFFPIYLFSSLLLTYSNYFILSFISNFILHFSFFITFYLSPSLYLQFCGQAYALLVLFPCSLQDLQYLINPGNGTSGPISLSAPESKDEKIQLNSFIIFICSEMIHIFHIELFLEEEMVGSFLVKKNFLFSLILFGKLLMLILSSQLGSV